MTLFTKHVNVNYGPDYLEFVTNPNSQQPKQGFWCRHYTETESQNGRNFWADIVASWNLKMLPEVLQSGPGPLSCSDNSLSSFIASKSSFSSSGDSFSLHFLCTSGVKSIICMWTPCVNFWLCQQNLIKNEANTPLITKIAMDVLEHFWSKLLDPKNCNIIGKFQFRSPTFVIKRFLIPSF